MQNSKLAFIEECLNRINAVRQRVMDSFYYLESDELSYKPSENSWSVVECIEHINLVNNHYLSQLDILKETAEQAGDEQLRSSWFGKKFAKSMAPGEAGISNRMKTFKKVDPTARRKQGYAVVEKVVFQNLMLDLQRLEGQLELAKSRSVKPLKIKSLLPVLRFRFMDAVNLVLNHTDRHLLQAEKTLQTS
jgi:hypothetical protein